MTTQTPTRPTQGDFADAWNDLRTRITDALDTFRDMIAKAVATEKSHPDPHVRAIAKGRAQHLRHKRTGLDDAYTIWENQHERAIASGDYAGTWRTFTDTVFAAWGATPDGTPHQQGIALALDYQRGYSEDIDAPPLVALTRMQQQRKQATRS